MVLPSDCYFLLFSPSMSQAQPFVCDKDAREDQKKLKCEALTSVRIASRSVWSAGRSDIVCQFAEVRHLEDDCCHTYIPIYLGCAPKTSLLCWKLCAGGTLWQGPRLRAVSIPNHVTELRDGCFLECQNLGRVTFGSSSSLKRIGCRCFAGTAIREVSIPDSVLELSNNCFEECRSLCHVTFRHFLSWLGLHVLCVQIFVK